MKKILLPLLLVSSVSFGQIRFNQILSDHHHSTTVQALDIYIKNYGSTTVDISNYWIRNNGQAYSVSSLNIGNLSLQIAPGQTIELKKENLDIKNTPNRSLALFKSNNFTTSSELLDFFQYGGTGSVNDETLAINKGIWTNNSFAESHYITISPGGAYIFNGTETQYGLAYWSQIGLLSINEEIKFNATIFPNPAQNTFMVKLQNKELKNKLSIYNLTGKRILEGTTNATIDISNLQRGLYLIKISFKEKKITKKLIIN